MLHKDGFCWCSTYECFERFRPYDLTSKLNASGFTKSLLELLKSYLTICWHKINSTKSISQEVLVIMQHNVLVYQGIPQSIVLRPWSLDHAQSIALYHLYQRLNDLYWFYLTTQQTVQYANDTFHTYHLDLKNL